jgi:hypothetical protein
VHGISNVKLFFTVCYRSINCIEIDLFMHFTVQIMTQLVQNIAVLQKQKLLFCNNNNNNNNNNSYV